MRWAIGALVFATVLEHSAAHATPGGFPELSVTSLTWTTVTFEIAGANDACTVVFDRDGITHRLDVRGTGALRTARAVGLQFNTTYAFRVRCQGPSGALEGKALQVQTNAPPSPKSGGPPKPKLEWKSAEKDGVVRVRGTVPSALNPTACWIEVASGKGFAPVTAELDCTNGMTIDLGVKPTPARMVARDAYGMQFSNVIK